MSDEDFPVQQMKHFEDKKSSEDVQRLKGSRKDCKMNAQRRCEEKLRTDKSLSQINHYHFSTAKENSNMDSNYQMRKENVCRDFSAYVF